MGGAVGTDVAEFDGPVGLRTDNARFEFDYYAHLLGSDLSSAAATFAAMANSVLLEIQVSFASR